MREIKLTRGQVAIVDDEDFDFVGGFNWFATKPGHRRTMYAVRNVRIKPGKGPGCRITKKMHREIAVRANILADPNDPRQVDHVDGNGLNNTRANLRVASCFQQNANTAKRRTWKKAPCSSRYKGVYWRRDRMCWRTRIMINGKFISIGHFHDEAEAARAYDQAARATQGEFVTLNFPD